MRQVLAKFRCMSVTKKWDRSCIVELSPVCQRGSNKENEQFWKFTPSGDATLNFKGPSKDDRGQEYTPGDYYYIYMTKDEGGGWLLNTITTHGKENGSVELATNGKDTVGWKEGDGFSYGKLQMGIDNPHAFLAFDEIESTWDVQFKWAELSDD
jgi:hypothetical protein